MHSFCQNFVTQISFACILFKLINVLYQQQYPFLCNNIILIQNESRLAFLKENSYPWAKLRNREENLPIRRTKHAVKSLSRSDNRRRPRPMITLSRCGMSQIKYATLVNRSMITTQTVLYCDVTIVGLLSDCLVTVIWFCPHSFPNKYHRNIK